RLIALGILAAPLAGCGTEPACSAEALAGETRQGDHWIAAEQGAHGPSASAARVPRSECQVDTAGLSS
ncbi:MAG TPA: hypothetical protein VFZ87_04450, partial [Gemmatimonadales bacterium]